MAGAKSRFLIQQKSPRSNSYCKQFLIPQESESRSASCTEQDVYYEAKIYSIIVYSIDLFLNKSAHFNRIDPPILLQNFEN
ncbi:MAG: hypothetical protein CMP14_02515 [Rickettsiales bacterium]|nr:hypothetical protein [Rickettsiales bacterium]